MTAKEYLSRLYRFESQYHHRLDILDRLRAELAPIKGLRYDTVRVQTSPDGSPSTEKAIDQIVDIEAELINELGSLLVERQKIIAQIEGIEDDRYSRLLYLRYVEGMSLTSIAKDMGYSRDWIFKAHGRALSMFAQAYGLDQSKVCKPIPTNTN